MSSWWDAVRDWFRSGRKGDFPEPNRDDPDPVQHFTGREDWLTRRKNLTTGMKSREISEAWSAKIRAQAFFSARVEQGHILDKLREVSDAFTRGEIGQAEARTILKEFLASEGYDPRRGGLGNLASTGRLNLILEQNARMAYAVGRWQEGMDSDIKERFPCWRYVGSTAAAPRDSHARYANHVYAKDDPIWHTIFPPSDFGCKCSVEDCDDPAEKAPEDVGPAESGFAFDPAHAFEEFDLSSIKDEAFRADVARDMQQQFKGEYHDMKLWLHGKPEPKDPEPVAQDTAERAEEETRKILPNTLVRWYTPEAERGSRDPRHVVHNVDSLNRINEELHRIKQQTGSLDEIKILTAEHLDQGTGGRAHPATGRIGLNIDYLNGYDWSKHPQKGGQYTDSASRIYAGKEIECLIGHEVWHLKCKSLFGEGLPEEQITPTMRERHKKLVTAWKRAASEGILSEHGRADEWEFFSEIKIWEEFDKKPFPGYIKTILEDLR